MSQYILFLRKLNKLPEEIHLSIYKLIFSTVLYSISNMTDDVCFLNTNFPVDDEDSIMNPKEIFLMYPQTFNGGGGILL